MRSRIKTLDWLRPLMHVLVRIIAWTLVLAILGAIGAYLAMLYFTLKGF